MCNPTAMFALQAFTAITDYVGQKRQAEDEENAANENKRLLLEDIAAQQQEVNENAAAEKSDAAIQALKEKGRQRVASGENFGGGITAQLLLGDIDAQLGREQSTVELSRQRKQKQKEREKEGVKARTQSTINSIKQPSIIGTGLQIAGSYVSNNSTSTKKKTDK